jgi:cytochrome c5
MPRRISTWVPVVVASISVLVSEIAFGDEPAYREFDDPSLAQGRVVWLGNCEPCHGYGVAGAPIPMQADDWRARIAKDEEVLHEHALNGFYGPDDTYMPPRGGNPQLNDDQVRSAVDYMRHLATYYIRKEESER